MRRLDVLVRDAWSLVAPYWRSEERWRAGALLGITLLLNLGLVAVAVLFTFWQRSFYNALESKDWPGYISLMLWWRVTPKDGLTVGFLPLAALFVLFTVYALYLRQALQIRWRRWLTARLMDDWFADRAYYRIGLTDPGTDNPDQRIADDIRLFVDNTLILGLGIVHSIFSLCSFVVILWSFSDSAVLFGVTIPGYLVWVALLYAGIGTWITHLVGRRLIGLNYTEQKVEADLRFGLMRCRENAEGIALYGGEADEKRELSRRFGLLSDNWYAIMTVTKRLTFFTTGFGQVALVFPLAVVAPAYFAGRIPLGGIFQISSAFVQVQGALSWFVDNYGSFTAWCATVDRLTGFARSIAAARRPAQGPKVIEGSGNELSVSGLTVALPDGRRLLHDFDVRIAPRERVLLKGASGCGKSTIFRAFAGIWPFGSGEIVHPAARLLFLPQRAYLPAGTLKRVVCYPLNEQHFSDAQVSAALHRAGLDKLNARLDETDIWERRLSGGEQQRMALARALLIKPEWLFLDEATASLDAAAEESAYTTLCDCLPETTLVSIAHSDRVAKFHNRTLHFEGGSLAAVQL
jgi:putative ATP-binding cassette transporter